MLKRGVFRMRRAHAIDERPRIIRSAGDMAKFGSILFLILAPLQLALMAFLAAMRSASSVSQEKDKKTILLLLMTRLSNHELVLGKLLASLLDVLVMLATALAVGLGLLAIVARRAPLLAALALGASLYQGYTATRAYHYGFYKGITFEIPIFALLIAAGARLDAENACGWLPWHIANGVAYDGNLIGLHDDTAALLRRLM